MGKIHKAAPHALSGGGERDKESMYRVYSDVAGPLPPSTIHGFTYLVNFVDGFSGYGWVYGMKDKSAASIVQAMKQFLADAAPLPKVKIIRTDNGREFENKEEMQLLLDRGIKHETTTPYTPRQNGVSE